MGGLAAVYHGSHIDFGGVPGRIYVAADPPTTLCLKQAYRGPWSALRLHSQHVSGQGVIESLAKACCLLTVTHARDEESMKSQSGPGTIDGRRERGCEAKETDLELPALAHRLVGAEVGWEEHRNTQVYALPRGEESFTMTTGDTGHCFAGPFHGILLNDSIPHSNELKHCLSRTISQFYLSLLSTGKIRGSSALCTTLHNKFCREIPHKPNEHMR